MSFCWILFVDMMNGGLILTTQMSKIELSLTNLYPNFYRKLIFALLLNIDPTCIRYVFLVLYTKENIMLENYWYLLKMKLFKWNSWLMISWELLHLVMTFMMRFMISWLLLFSYGYLINPYNYMRLISNLFMQTTEYNLLDRLLIRPKLLLINKYFF